MDELGPILLMLLALASGVALGFQAGRDKGHTERLELLSRSMLARRPEQVAKPAPAKRAEDAAAGHALPGDHTA